MTAIHTGALAARIGQLSLLALLLLPVAPDRSVAQSTFDHFTTGYRLEGAHRFAECESCHTDGMFTGTVRHCSGCHNQASRSNATSQPQTHITTTNRCAACHRPNVWVGITRVDHFETLGACSSCHNGRKANGKPVTHVPAGNSCEDCHNTVAWQ